MCAILDWSLVWQELFVWKFVNVEVEEIIDFKKKQAIKLKSKNLFKNRFSGFPPSQNEFCLFWQERGHFWRFSQNFSSLTEPFPPVTLNYKACVTIMHSSSALHCIYPPWRTVSHSQFSFSIKADHSVYQSVTMTKNIKQYNLLDVGLTGESKLWEVRSSKAGQNLRIGQGKLFRWSCIMSGHFRTSKTNYNGLSW